MIDGNGHDRSSPDAGGGFGAEDVALKSAIRRAVGGETAPAALRQRVTAALAAAAASEAIAAQAAASTTAAPAEVVGRIGPAPVTRGGFGMSRWRFAAAAIFFVAALGVVVYQVMNIYGIGQGSGGAPMIAQLPKSMAREMVD